MAGEDVPVRGERLFVGLQKRVCIAATSVVKRVKEGTLTLAQSA